MDGRFKIVFLVAVLAFTSFPLIGILQGPKKPPPDPIEQVQPPSRTPNTQAESDVPIIRQDMVKVPGGAFVRGTDDGGYNERPRRIVQVATFWIDRYEVTNHHYGEFVAATGHRRPGPPSRYARNLVNLRGPNQPVTYVAWADARAFCEWKGKRLPTETEWEKAMRGTDGRTWPWGEGLERASSNLGGEQDGFQYTAPVGSFARDQSVFGVYDGAGNLMEWVDNWYVERLYEAQEAGAISAQTKTYKTLRGGGYTSVGSDLRITSRMFMVPDFRDETIGFRCASSDETAMDSEAGMGIDDA